MSPAPKNILYIRPDTFGDIVLFEPALRELMVAWPDAKHTLLVRPGYESLASLFPQQLNWQVATMNPFTQGPAESRTALADLLAILGADPPDLIIAATLNRTWLEVALAAQLPKARCVALGDGRVNPLFTTALALEMGANVEETFKEQVAADNSALEWENNLRLVGHLLGRKVPRHHPHLEIPKSTAAQASSWLDSHKIIERQWVAIFPAGTANVKIKAWEPTKFAETAAWLHRQYNQSLVLLGHVSETSILNEVSAGIVKLGLPKPPIWLGQEGEIPLLAALLKSSRFYFGNDTGAMHIAAAVGRPVAAIFGGGHGLRFKPVAHQAISLFQPLPCFGCKWDCHFGDAPCVKSLQVADAQAALTKLLDAGNQPLDAIHEANNFPAITLELIAASTPRYQQLQQDRLDRQYKIEELTHLGRAKDVENAELKRAADAIKAELEGECAKKDNEIKELKVETDTKDAEISALKNETNVKDTEIVSLKSETDTKDKEITQLKHAADTKDTEIEQLKATCNEREALIFKLTDIVKDFQKKVADMEITLQGREAEIIKLTNIVKDFQKKGADMEITLQGREAEIINTRTDLEHLQARFAALPPDSTQYAQWLYDKDVHIANLERATAARDLQIRELNASINNYHQGYGELEQIKRYGQWLNEKEAVIQQLKRVCNEREALVKQLAVSAIGLGRLRVTCAAFAEYLRQKYWQSSMDWIFNKTVEDYWMKLGVLRHYEPRLLQWDKRLPKFGRLPESALPTFVIVTPSFNQDKFIESTILSVVNQRYPHLHYRIQDGGSTDRSVEIIKRYADRMTSWQSIKDRGQSDAIRRGFDQLPGDPDDIMAWLNSDDFIANRALRYVAEYFARHPKVDAVYGHRIIIDEHDREIGRWIMPPHNPAVLEWIDYVPQETLFFRRRIWNAVGGMDPAFQFALDWDLLARFQQAGAKIVRLPYFLGCFRIHSEQKTSAHIHTTGHEEMTRIRTRIHGPNFDPTQIESHARKARFSAAIHARLHSLGLRI